MGDVSWTLNFYMKDAPPGENFLEERMERDLICYFEIFDLIKKYGYTTRDDMYCKRDGHGRRKTCLVKINNDRDVGKMLLEHEADQKLILFVEKHSASLNTVVHVAGPNHAGASDDALEGYDTESSNATDHETDRDELEHELEAMKRRRDDPSVQPKRQKRPRNSRFQSEDQEHEEHGGDLDDPLEPLEDGEEDEDNMQASPVHSENEDQDLAELDTTVSGVSPESGSIKIIWPNGVVQEYRGRFTVSNVMNIKSGGKKKFLYREETKHNKEEWMLKIVNKGWRAYKSLLKNEYYKPDKWSLDRIKRRVPIGVNKHQWIKLLGTWCQDQHVKTCQRNSEAGKQQCHPHATGRKSHARLKKEMEVKNKGPVSKIDLWDEAHKKKDGNYENENVKQLMHKAHKELASLKRKKNGDLSPEDYEKVFDDVIAKDSTIVGYYDEKYWGDARLCQGSTSAQESASEVRAHKELQEAKEKLKNVTGVMQRMCAFLARNHPEEDWMKGMMAAENEIKIGDQAKVGPASMLQANNISVNILDRAGGGHEVDVEESMDNVQVDVEEAMDNVHTTKVHPKESARKESPEQQTSQQVNYSKRVNTAVIQHKVNETAESNEIV